VVYPTRAASWTAGACCGRRLDAHSTTLQFTNDLLASSKGLTASTRAAVRDLACPTAGHSPDSRADERRVRAIARCGRAGIDASKCNPKRSVPVAEFHGTSYPIVRTGRHAAAPIFRLGVSDARFRSSRDTISICAADRS